MQMKHPPKDIVVELNSTQCLELLSRSGIGVIDVRPRRDYTISRLPGAMNIDILSNNAIESLSRLQRSNGYLVYCGSGTRSKSTIKIMKALGFTSLYVLANGLSNYQGPLDLTSIA